MDDLMHPNGNVIECGRRFNVGEVVEAYFADAGWQPVTIVNSSDNCVCVAYQRQGEIGSRPAHVVTGRLNRSDKIRPVNNG